MSLSSGPIITGPDTGTWQGILELWHAHRLPILALVVLCACCVQTWPNRRNGNSRSSEVREPAGKDSESKSPRLTEPPPPKHAPGTQPSAVVLPTTPLPVRHNGPKRIKGGLRQQDAPTETGRPADTTNPVQVLVFFSSVTATTQRIAGEFVRALDDDIRSRPVEGRPFRETRLLDLAEIDFDDYFVAPPAGPDSFYLVLVPSYNIDTINDTFLEHLRETHNDFRIDTAPLAAGLLGYSVFGFGDREGWPTEPDGFCFQAREVDRWMARLTGRKRAYPLGMGDAKVDCAQRLSEWRAGVAEVLEVTARTGTLGDGIAGSGNADESSDEDEGDDGDDVPGEEAATMDLEDLGKTVRRPDARPRAPLAVDFTSYGGPPAARKTHVPAAKEMVPADSPTYKSLTKQGYTIVGSHSGVKICRWTKSALRGRGSCYKFSFYGISSHQCMETTPSLSCSSKCVFCWRHGSNPIGTTWRWVVDPAEAIFEGVKKGHYQKIKVLRGMAGVRAERYAEAMSIRHCALSLVGEPIFYPEIDKFLALLHAERISSFLVCNAQHPEPLAALKAVTQLYVSIDASNRESLRRIDRPLFRDFWERFLRCLDILRERRFRHRTVFRLTLVKGFNVEDEVDGYADLIERGLPCFVEVKGVTYCGTATSASAGLSMGNVPFYWEVCDFVRALDARLRARGLDYGIAAEHAHSCCVLIASERFRVDGRWHTLIDYDRFFRLLEERGVDGEWTPEEYMGAATPEWATWGNGGFDPRDDRVDRKGRKIAA